MKKKILISMLTMQFVLSAAFAGSIADMTIPENIASIPAPVLKGTPPSPAAYESKLQRQLNPMSQMETVDVLFVGDSIMNGWRQATNPGGDLERGLDVWNEHYKPIHAFNVGIPGDKTQNVLWRLQNGLLENISPKVAILTIGQNNKTTQEEIADGMLAILREIRRQSPETKILFIPHFPTTRANWKTSKYINAYNIAVEKAKEDEYIIPTDLNAAFLNEAGVLKDKSLIPDDIHPAKPGYQLWHEEMAPILKKLLAESDGASCCPSAANSPLK